MTFQDNMNSFEYHTGHAVEKRLHVCATCAESKINISIMFIVLALSAQFFVPCLLMPSLVVHAGLEL